MLQRNVMNIYHFPRCRFLYRKGVEMQDYGDVKHCSINVKNPTSTMVDVGFKKTPGRIL
jgi:hypothetical protein